MAQEENKSTRYQCWSDRLCDIRSLDAWRGELLPLQASSLKHTREKRNTTEAQLLQHIIPNLLQKILHAILLPLHIPLHAVAGSSGVVQGEYVNVWLDDAQMTCFSLKVLEPPMRA